MDLIKAILGRRIGLGSQGELLVNNAAGVQSSVGMVATVTIPAAQVLTLFTTPRTLIASPGAGLAIDVQRVAIVKPSGTAYAGIAAGEDLVLRLAGSASVFMTVETTGFLDQATAQTRACKAVATDYTPLPATALQVALLVGDITTGTSDLTIRVWYDLINTTFTP